MLVLSRKPGERIFLNVRGVRIEIITVRVGPNVVRLGIEAPAEVDIERDDCLQRPAVPSSRTAAATV